MLEMVLVVFIIALAICQIAHTCAFGCKFFALFVFAISLMCMTTAIGGFLLILFGYIHPSIALISILIAQLLVSCILMIQATIGHKLCEIIYSKAGHYTQSICRIIVVFVKRNWVMLIFGMAAYTDYYMEIDTVKEFYKLYIIYTKIVQDMLQRASG